jgi:hypothetical protein
MSDDLKVVVVRRELYYHEIEYVRGLENLAAAVLLYLKGGPWTAADQQAWLALTNTTEATTKSLADFARKVQSHD